MLNMVLCIETISLSSLKSTTLSLSLSAFKDLFYAAKGMIGSIHKSREFAGLLQHCRWCWEYYNAMLA